MVMRQKRAEGSLRVGAVAPHGCPASSFGIYMISLSLSLAIYIYIYTHMRINIYIYMYREREREREIYIHILYYNIIISNIRWYNTLQHPVPLPVPHPLAGRENAVPCGRPPFKWRRAVT